MIRNVANCSRSVNQKMNKMLNCQNKAFSLVFKNSNREVGDLDMAQDETKNERWELSAHNLRRLLKRAGISQVELSKRLDRDPTQINQMCRGRRGIGADIGRKLIDFFATHGIMIDHHDFFKPIDAVEEEGRSIKVFEEGLPLGRVETEQPTRMEMTSSRDPKAFYYCVKENLVGGEIREGDLLLVEPGRKVKSGDLVLVSLQEEVMVRRHHDRKGITYLEDLNGREPIILEEGEAPDHSWRVSEIKRKL